MKEELCKFSLQWYYNKISVNFYFYMGLKTRFRKDQRSVSPSPLWMWSVSHFSTKKKKSQTRMIHDRNAYFFFYESVKSKLITFRIYQNAYTWQQHIITGTEQLTCLQYTWISHWKGYVNYLYHTNIKIEISSENQFSGIKLDLAPTRVL